MKILKKLFPCLLLSLIIGTSSIVLSSSSSSGSSSSEPSLIPAPGMNMSGSAGASGEPTSGANAGAGPVPSVAQVFGGMSEQEIAEQVQMGQKILEDLHSNGSPEMIAEFYKMLEDTINNMSDQDFQDIQAISEMVKPHLPEPTFTAPPTPSAGTESAASSASSSSSAEQTPADSSAVATFKTLISSIIQRIDDIMQKINSSKECAELLDTKWNNKATFDTMKRQIYLLKNDRLAQKLAKDDLSDDDKTLVANLKKFLKTLTKHNDTLKIEDDFGLSSSLSQEKKHLKETQSFLDSCDDAIDTLMPLLEKFLKKHDPEALQMAKEADAQAKKAKKDATDTAKFRKESPNARPTGSSLTSNYGPTNYQDYGSYYPDYYDQSGSYYPAGGYTGAEVAEPKSSSSAGPAGASATPKSEIAPKAGEKPREIKDKDDLYNGVVNDLEGIVNDDYSAKHENDFVNLMQSGLVNQYPKYQQILREGVTPVQANLSGSIGSGDPEYENAWIDSVAPFGGKGFKAYTIKALNDVSKFTEEFESEHSILDKIKNNIFKMSADELNKLTTNKYLEQLHNRLNRYEATFKNMVPKLDTQMSKNAPNPAGPATTSVGSQDLVGIEATDPKTRYFNEHRKFVDTLEKKISDEIKSLQVKINSIKKSAKRAATKKK
jgi:hypothetical protein